MDEKLFDSLVDWTATYVLDEETGVVEEAGDTCASIVLCSVVQPSIDAPMSVTVYLKQYGSSLLVLCSVSVLFEATND